MQIKLIGLRKKNKETQKDIAEMLKISENSYRNKELGKSEFRCYASNYLHISD